VRITDLSEVVTGANLYSAINLKFSYLPVRSQVTNLPEFPWLQSG